MIVGILVTSYNDDMKLINRALVSMYRQNYEALQIVCVDDGSTIPLEDSITLTYNPSRLTIMRISHGERYIARQAGLDRLRIMGCTHFLFLDSDMVLQTNFISVLVDFANMRNADAVLIPEHAFSECNNFWTRVKVFERNLYLADHKIGKTSIEAARFWTMSAFPGFVEGLNAFEEIQPTLRLLESGGNIVKCSFFIEHDEKRVSLSGLLRKKNYYFSAMGAHEKVRLSDVWPRFYFFRSQLYHRVNLKRYVHHPILAIGVFSLYLLLSFNVCLRFMAQRLKREIFRK